MVKKYMIRILVGLLVLAVGIRIINRVSSTPSGMGVENGKLAECPSSRNCVSSQVPRQNSHFIEPFRLPRNPQSAIDKLASDIDDIPRSTLVTKTENYLHFEFRSLLFGFVDDVEFLRDVSGGVIHIRSAARLGYSDFGVNRKRIERIRQIWQAF